MNDDGYWARASDYSIYAFRQRVLALKTFADQRRAHLASYKDTSSRQ